MWTGRLWVGGYTMLATPAQSSWVDEQFMSGVTKWHCCHVDIVLTCHRSQPVLSHGEYDTDPGWIKLKQLDSFISFIHLFHIPLILYRSTSSYTGFFFHRPNIYLPAIALWFKSIQGTESVYIPVHYKLIHWPEFHTEPDVKVLLNMYVETLWLSCFTSALYVIFFQLQEYWWQLISNNFCKCSRHWNICVYSC